LKVTSNLVDNSLTTGPAALTYTSTAAYSAGIATGTFATTGIADTGNAAVAANDQTVDATIDLGTASSGGGVATISYTDKAGTSLSGTDLSTQADAETALTSLNSAITAVAAQDGYIGAQINTLNAVSSVLSTQAENVTAAQNAVQATDYASATSNMSKYEILSQTGISALAQANSMQQEVTKLLQ
jgi:flagellin